MITKLNEQYYATVSAQTKKACQSGLVSRAETSTDPNSHDTYRTVVTHANSVKFAKTQILFILCLVRPVKKSKNAEFIQ